VNNQKGAHEHGEIIIVRRGHDDHDDHHGGVWKIAFADFMTAMMAFFLVMWLINAANEETKKSVASYFNPVKLMDTTTNPRGVKNPKYGDVTPEEEEPSEAESTTVTSENKVAVAKDSEKSAGFSEQALFVDPLAMISEIAGGVGEDISKDKVVDEGTGAGSANKGLSGGSSFQDPFDPSAWNLKYGTSDNVGEEGATQPFPEDKSVAKRDMAPETEEGSQKAGAGTAEVQSEAAEKAEPQAKPEEILAEKISGVLAAPADGKKLNFEVRALDDGGVLVSIMEDATTAMFEIGSARPSRAMVLAMQRVASSILETEKKVTVQGHTDGRPFKSDTYDNWRLSTARAHMAMYMLESGGLTEDRFKRVEGYADRQLKLPDEPFAAGNRRIEIILSDG
jgi:chemotaxis protein MotB